MNGNTSPHTRGNLLAVAVLAVLVFASYGNTLAYPFMWDDKTLVLYNTGLRNGWTSVVNAFSPEKWGGRVDNDAFQSFYRPTHSLLSILDYQVWGLNPFGYHLSNTLVHLFNTVFLFFLGARLAGDRAAAMTAAALFAVHPAHTESVTFISARVDLLAAAALLPSFYLYLRSAGRMLGLSYAASLLLFLVALLSKEMALTFPAMLALYAWLLEERGGRALRVVPYFLVLAGYILFRVFGLEVFVSQHHLRADLPTLISTASAAVFDYIRLLAAPWPLKALYSIHWQGPLAPKALAGFAVMVAALAAFWTLCRGGNRKAAFFLAWTFVALAPVMNIGALGEFAIAERYLYIPSIGFTLLVGAAVSRLTFRQGGRVVPYATVALIALFAVLTFQRNRVWADDLTFFSAMVKGAPDSAIARGNLSHALMAAGRADEAISEMAATRDLVPGNHIVRYELGLYLFKAGRVGEAAVELAAAIERKPDYEQALNLLGVAFAELGRKAEAEAAFRRAIEVNPASGAGENLLRLTGGEPVR